MPGDEVETFDDDCIYRVLDTDDRMGRIQMSKITYRVFSFEYDLDNTFDCYDDAVEFIDDYKNLSCSDIDEELDRAHAFWMDYRDVYKHY